MVDDESSSSSLRKKVRGDSLDESGFDRDCPVIHTSAYGALHDDAPDHEKWVESVKELMKAVDEYIPTPTHDLDKPFLMPIEDVFTISGRGTVVTGRVERGKLPVNSTSRSLVSRPDRPPPSPPSRPFTSRWMSAGAGDNTGLLLRGIIRDQVSVARFWLLRAPVTPHAPSSRAKSTC